MTVHRQETAHGVRLSLLKGLLALASGAAGRRPPPGLDEQVGVLKGIAQGLGRSTPTVLLPPPASDENDVVHSFPSLSASGAISIGYYIEKMAPRQWFCLSPFGWGGFVPYGRPKSRI
jgi:hypothetical protein